MDDRSEDESDHADGSGSSDEDSDQSDDSSMDGSDDEFGVDISASMASGLSNKMQEEFAKLEKEVLASNASVLVLIGNRKALCKSLAMWKIKPRRVFMPEIKSSYGKLHCKQGSGFR